jgi:gluconolactonase
MEWEFEHLHGPLGGVTEGPVWTGSGLLFTHVPTSRVFHFDPFTHRVDVAFRDTGRANGLAVDRAGRVFGCAGAARAVVQLARDDRHRLLPCTVDGARLNGPNDLVIDRKDRIWFTDPVGRGASYHQPEIDHASVFRLDPAPGHRDGYLLRRMTFDTDYPNGILLSRDERTLYVAVGGYHLPARELRAYPLRDDDTLGAYRTLHTFGREYPSPEERASAPRTRRGYVERYGVDALGVHRGIDGMCLDADGNIAAAAGWHEAGPGPMIYVLSPQGRVLETHPVPVRVPTNCCFGGPDHDDFYLTSNEGHLLRARATVRRGWLPHLTRRGRDTGGDLT